MGRTHANRDARKQGHGGGTPPTPPSAVTVVSVTPPAGNTNVPLDRSPKATFNVAMNASTITTSTMQINAGAIAGAVSYDATNLRATFNPTAALAENTSYTVKVVGGGSGVKSGAGGQMAADKTWSFTTVDLADPPPPPPPVDAVVGYGASTTGGGAVVTHTIPSGAPDAWQQLSTALKAVGRRYILITGSTVISGGGQTVNVDNANMTLDGEGWTKSLKRAGIRIKASNIIIRHMRLRPGDEVSTPDDVDGLTINPGSNAGQFCDNIVVDHCSILWGPDIGGIALLNGVRNATIQYCVLGAGLYLSAHYEATPALNGHAKGSSVTQIGQAVEHGSNQTWYRNLITTSTDRNPHIFGVSGMDFVNNVIYNWERFCPRGNPRGLNFVSNVHKKGPDTIAHESVFMSDTNSTDTVIYANSVWLGHASTSGGNNFAIGFTLDDDCSSIARRSSAFGTISVTPATADAALGAAVVAGAGPTADAIDTLLKGHYTAGTSDGLYNGTQGNGAGSPAPHPSW